MKPALAFCMFFQISSLALASIEEDQLRKIKDGISQEKSLITESEVKKRSILGSLYDINKTLGKLNSEIQTLEKQLRVSKDRIQTQSATIANLEKTRDQEKVWLAQRLRALYKLGLQGYAQMLLSSHSSQEFARNLKFMKIVTEKDAHLLKSYKDNIFRLAQEQLKLRGQVRNFLTTQKTLASSKSKYDAEKQQQFAILNKIDKDKQTHLEALKEWRDAAVKLEEKMRAIDSHSVLSEISKAAFFEKQGQFRPPVLRKIVQKFGLSVDSKFDTKIFHKGLFFAAHTGDPVMALYNGKVVYSGWVNGFGNTIILDHGDHYYSLYAHNTEILKKSGENVDQGEIISRAGDTGSLRGPGLYFEIRHFSESLDPLPWLDLRTVAKL